MGANQRSNKWMNQTQQNTNPAWQPGVSVPSNVYDGGTKSNQQMGVPETVQQVKPQVQRLGAPQRIGQPSVSTGSPSSSNTWRGIRDKSFIARRNRQKPF